MLVVLVGFSCSAGRLVVLVGVSVLVVLVVLVGFSAGSAGRLAVLVGFSDAGSAGSAGRLSAAVLVGCSAGRRLMCW